MKSHGQLESDPLAGDEKYEMIKQLGRGAFGSVVLAKEKDTGQLVRTAHCSLSSHCMHPRYCDYPFWCTYLRALYQTRVCAAQIALVRARTALLSDLLVVACAPPCKQLYFRHSNVLAAPACCLYQQRSS